MLTVVGLSHAEDVANRATRGVADYDKPASEQAEAEDSAFTIVLTRVLDLDGDTLEDNRSVLEVQTSFSQRSFAFGQIEGDAHAVIVSTITRSCNGPTGVLTASNAGRGP